MPAFLNALLCGILGAFAAHIAYVQSNLFILGDVTRRNRHLLFDPLAFDAMGLLWGLVAGAACAALLRAAGPAKAVLIGIAVTLSGVAVVGGAATVQRYIALPRTPMIDGQELLLEVELRLPRDTPPGAQPPTGGEFRTKGQGMDIARFVFVADKAETRDGRIIVPATIELRRAVRDRRLEVFNGKTPWPVFDLSLPAYPSSTDMQWSSWYPADSGRDTWVQKSAMGYQIRFRVQPNNQAPAD